jgi:uncharacterized protein (TIGR02231 family)
VTSPREEKPFPSHALAVTFFEDRAEVVRKATVAVGPDPQWVSVSGVSPYLDDRSLQAKAAEPVRVLAARVHRRVTQQGEVGREEITALETAERLARERLREAGRRIERRQNQRERLTVMLSDWSRSLARVPVDTRSGKSEDWKASYRGLEARLREAMSHEALAQAAEQDARDALTSASARLAQARVTRPICEAFVLVQLAAPKSGPVEVELTYRTPCALWRPEHAARLLIDNDDAKSGQIEITSWATVWQSTGEEWSSIEAKFSTARPARSASPPSLTEDLIALRRKSDEERRVIHVEARDQAIAKTEVGEGVREVDEMPGVDDGGLPLSFSAAGTISLPSHGRPFRVEIGRITLPASLARILVPELAQVAHYKASATLASKTPLLAGPIGLLRGSSMVGRARMAYVAPGEPFVLGFGQDDNLRLRRTEETKQEQTAIVGTQKIERTVHIYLSNLSDTGRGVTLIERIPVSEIAEVQVELLEAKGFEHDAQDGFLSAEVTVGPRETRELALTYELRAKSNVQL